MEGAVDPCLAVDGRGCECGLIYSGNRAARLGLLAIMPMTDLRGGDSVITERSFFLVNKPLLDFGRNSIVSGEARVAGYIGCNLINSGVNRASSVYCRQLIAILNTPLRTVARRDCS